MGGRHSQTKTAEMQGEVLALGLALQRIKISLSLPLGSGSHHNSGIIQHLTGLLQNLSINEKCEVLV